MTVSSGPLSTLEKNSQREGLRGPREDVLRMFVWSAEIKPHSADYVREVDADTKTHLFVVTTDACSMLDMHVDGLR